MRERPLVRLALVCLLLGVVALQLVDYAAHEADHRIYPTATDLDSDFEQYHGQSVDVWLTVEGRTEDGFRATNGWAVTAETLPSDLDPDEKVQVYGVARPGPSIAADRVVVTDAWNRTYMLVVSALALVLTVGYTLRHWRPVPTRASVRPRTRQGEDRP